LREQVLTMHRLAGDWDTLRKACFNATLQFGLYAASASSPTSVPAGSPWLGAGG